MPWWVAAGMSLIVAFATVLWWWLPKWQVNRLRLQIHDPKACADVEDNFRKSIGQLFGGAVVLVGAGFAYYQSQLVWQASRDQLISQQVSKGFEQLGNDKIVIRLGGIYALEGVMNTSEQYQQPVLEALCAFVRNDTKSEPVKGPPAPDIQASLDVIGRRAAEKGVVDLVEAQIPEARLNKLNLIGAILAGANLSGAYLIKAKLKGANLAGANLTGAKLFDADLTGAKLANANLNNAYLTGTKLMRADLIGADLTGANLEDADLTGARLFGATGPHLPSGGDPRTGVRLVGANLTGAYLTGADLTGADVLQSQLDAACGGAGTRLPPGLILKPCNN